MFVLTFSAEHPNNARAPACASIIDVPTFMPTFSPSSAAASVVSPFGIASPGSLIWLPSL